MLNHVWWGFSAQHGWVALERGTGEMDEELLFFRCSDGQIYKEAKERWNKPHYLFAPRYLESLVQAEQTGAQKQLDEHKSRWNSDYEKIAKQIKDHRVNQLRQIKETERQNIQSARGTFFSNLGKENPGTHKSIAKASRFTHCYACKEELDNLHGDECNSCGWIVCNFCGACGCGYTRTNE